MKNLILKYALAICALSSAANASINTDVVDSRQAFCNGIKSLSVKSELQNTAVQKASSFCAIFTPESLVSVNNTNDINAIMNFEKTVVAAVKDVGEALLALDDVLSSNEMARTDSSWDSYYNERTAADALQLSLVRQGL